ncbi:MAG: hypothetical protein AAGH68_10380 [Pseudomonadota bacterium]
MTCPDDIVATEPPETPELLSEADLDAASAGAYGGSNSCEPYAGDNTCEPPRKAGRANFTDLTIRPKPIDHSADQRGFTSD